MKANKIGSIFLVSILALTGLGVTYAGLTDTISVYGTVDTATVDLVIEEYSGTWVHKIWEDGYENEILIAEKPGFTPHDFDGDGIDEFLLEPVSYAKARDVTGDDPVNLKTGLPYDAAIEFNNIFPCIDFKADILFRYVGSIPCKLTYEWGWIGDVVDIPGEGNMDFLKWLMLNDYMTCEFFAYNEVTGEFDILVSQNYQLHTDDYLELVVTIHLPQLNWLQGLSGTGYLEFNVIQWNDLCDDETTDEKTGQNLPDYIVIAQIFHPGDISGEPSYIKTILSETGQTEPPKDDDDMDVWDGAWVGWCVDEDHTINPGSNWKYQVTLWSSLNSNDPDFPWPDPDWCYVNYMINNKANYEPYTYTQVQHAIWYFIDGGYTGTDAKTWEIINDALANGVDFVPEAGQDAAVARAASA